MEAEAKQAAARTATWFAKALRPLADYALPPRCPGCGQIVADDRQFCLTCWSNLQILDGPACALCSIPLPRALPGEAMQCGACLATPPPFVGAPGAVAYGDEARTVALRLKYGRRLGHARLMADWMARPLAKLDRGLPMLLMPVPLHRWRLWSRGFNQAALVGDHLARRTGLPHAKQLLVRRKATASLRGLGRREREKEVAGAFALADGAKQALAGQHVVLIDDVFASGATLRACAKVVRRGGAAEVSALCWARVVPEAMADSMPFDFASVDSDISV